MKMEHIVCSETSAYIIQTPGNYPKENIFRTRWKFEIKNMSSSSDGKSILKHCLQRAMPISFRVYRILIAFPSHSDRTASSVLCESGLRIRESPSYSYKVRTGLWTPNYTAALIQSSDIYMNRTMAACFGHCRTSHHSGRTLKTNSNSIQVAAMRSLPILSYPSSLILYQMYKWAARSLGRGGRGSLSGKLYQIMSISQDNCVPVA